MSSCFDPFFMSQIIVLNHFNTRKSPYLESIKRFMWNQEYSYSDTKSMITDIEYVYVYCRVVIRVYSSVNWYNANTMKCRK